MTNDHKKKLKDLKIKAKHFEKPLKKVTPLSKKELERYGNIASDL